MQTRTLIAVAVGLAAVIAGFFVLAPRQNEVTAEGVAPVTANPVTVAPDAPEDAAAAGADQAPAAAAADDAAPAAGADAGVPPLDIAVDPESFAVPPVDLELPEDGPTDAGKPAAPAAE